MNVDSANVDLKRCRECAHFRQTVLFDLCKHEASTYTALGEVDFHTIGHMRTIGACREDATLFEPVVGREVAGAE